MNKPIKVILTKVYINDTRKDGTPFVDRNNKPFKKVAIQTNIHGDAWLSALSYRDDDAVRLLVKGQSADIIVEENGEYLNFKLPSRLDLLEVTFGDLQRRVEKLEGGSPVDEDDQTVNKSLEEDIQASDLPF